MRTARKKRVARYRAPGYGDTLQRVAANVRHLREVRGWSQEEASSRAESMSERLYRLVESAQTNVTAATLTRLAEAFDVDVAALLAPVRSPSSRPRVKVMEHPIATLPPAVVASMLLDPSTLQDPAVAAALDALLRRREPQRVQNPSAAVETAVTEDGRPASDGGETRANPAALDGSATPVPVETVGPRVLSSVVAIPVVPKGADLRTFVIALLVANPRGLLTSEMAEAAADAKRRHRKNEIHEIVRSLQESGDLTRAGRKGSFVYALRSVGAPTR